MVMMMLSLLESTTCSDDNATCYIHDDYKQHVYMDYLMKNNTFLSEHYYGNGNRIQCFLHMFPVKLRIES